MKPARGLLGLTPDTSLAKPASARANAGAAAGPGFLGALSQGCSNTGDRARRARRKQGEARRPSIATGYVREEQRRDATRIVRRAGDRGRSPRIQ